MTSFHVARAGRALCGAPSPESAMVDEVTWDGKMAIDCCWECRDQWRFDRAEKIPASEWNGPVEIEDGWGDESQLFWWVDAAMQHMVDYNADCDPKRPWPRWVWAAEEEPFRLSAEQVLEAKMDDWLDESISDQLDYLPQGALEHLQKLLDIWCENNAGGLRRTHPIWPRKKAIVLPDQWWRDYTTEERTDAHPEQHDDPGQPQQGDRDAQEEPRAAQEDRR